MAIPYDFRNSTKGIVEGGFEHPAYDIWSRWIMPDSAQKYPLIWTVLGSAAFSAIAWFAIIDLASHMVR